MYDTKTNTLFLTLSMAYKLNHDSVSWCNDFIFTQCAICQLVNLVIFCDCFVRICLDICPGSFLVPLQRPTGMPDRTVSWFRKSVQPVTVRPALKCGHPTKNQLINNFFIIMCNSTKKKKHLFVLRCMELMSSCESPCVHEGTSSRLIEFIFANSLTPGTAHNTRILKWYNIKGLEIADSNWLKHHLLFSGHVSGEPGSSFSKLIKLIFSVISKTNVLIVCFEILVQRASYAV